jgi:hypothetical protein
MSEWTTEERLKELEHWAREGDDTEPGDVLALIADLRLARARVAALEGEVERLKRRPVVVGQMTVGRGAVGIVLGGDDE